MKKISIPSEEGAWHFDISSCGEFIVNAWSLRVLSQHKCKNGYYRVWSTSTDGKRKSFMSHRLVALAYLDNPENLPEVNHKDGNKDNNRSWNLEWCSRKENVTHARDVLKKNISATHSIYDDCQVLTMHTLKGHTKQAELAEHYKCHQATISKIQLGKHHEDIYVSINANRARKRSLLSMDIRFFKPRDKTLQCVHFVDCESCAEWCADFRDEEGSSYDYYCEKHKQELVEKTKTASQRSL